VDFVLGHTVGRGRVWDCATGNGQLAELLAPHFLVVEATDISANQLAAAVVLPNVRYSRQAAEQTDFVDGSFDLITVAQAIHWFDFEGFYAEVRRVARPRAMLAVIGYPLLGVTAEVDAVIGPFYHVTLQHYWDLERRYLDADYRTIPFPFAEVDCPTFESRYAWRFEQLMGYLNTWSAVKNYIREHGDNPLDNIESDLRAAWGEEESHVVTFRMLLRLGEIC
jgi:ubiquinone/menaquinone biosynthesis C-methylase UbiE